MASKQVSSSSFEVSYVEENMLTDMVDTTHAQAIMQSNQLKLCTQIQLRNRSAPVVLPLISKEKRGVFQSLLNNVRGRLYVHHGSIYLLYMPTILSTSSGCVTIKLFNEASGEVMDIDTDHDASQACIFAGRYPRSILASDASEGKGLKIIANVSASVNVDAVVGVLYPIWEDELHKKMIYEEDRCFLKFPVAETAPVRKLLNSKKLIDFVHARTRLGSGCESDPMPDVLRPKAVKGGRAKTVKFIPSAPAEPDVLPGVERDAGPHVVDINAGVASGPSVPKGLPVECFVKDSDLFTTPALQTF